MAGVLGVEKLSNTTRISETYRHCLADGVEEPLELDGPVAGGEFVDDQPACQIECRVQPDGAVTDVVVRAPFGCAVQKWEDRLGAVQGLDLCLLVHAEHNGPLEWVHVQPVDVSDLVDEQRVGRQLEGILQPRLEAECLPDEADRGWEISAGLTVLAWTSVWRLCVSVKVFTTTVSTTCGLSE